LEKKNRPTLQLADAGRFHRHAGDYRYGKGRRRREAPVSAKRVLLLVFGILFILGSILVIVAGGAMVWASQFHKDAEGFYVTDPMELSSGSYAVTSETIEIDNGASKALYWLGMDTIKTEVASNDASKPVFIGIAKSRDVEDYLFDVKHEELTDIDVFPSRFRYKSIPGNAQPQPPGSQGFWLEKSEGTGVQRIEFNLEEGDYTIVAMNADASTGINMDVVFGIKASGLVLALGIIFILIGLVVLAAGITMVVFGAKSPQQPIPPPPLPG
jgi:hypothetical protein